MRRSSVLRSTPLWALLLVSAPACFDTSSETGEIIDEAPLALGPNAIATENQNQGNADWPLVKPADARQIEGFASKTSVNAGDAVDIYVNLKSNATMTYDLELFRMGYYGGAGARLVYTATNQAGVAQPSPTTDAYGTAKCAWSSPHHLQTGATWVSGVYLARLTHKGTGHQSWVPIVVRNDSRTADYLFQVAVTSYQAYNNWPYYPTNNPDSAAGKSFYPGASAGGLAARKVSFDRPYGRGGHDTSLSGVGAGQFLTADFYHPNTGANMNNSASGWEYAMIRFLEKDGYDVAYQTDIDTDERPIPAQRYKAFLSVGHDEYWSRNMRSHLNDAQAAGVGVGVFGANVSYWNVRFEDDHHTMVGYKDNYSDDPLKGTLDETNNFTGTSVGLVTAGDSPEEDFIGASWAGGGGIRNADINIGSGDVCHWMFNGSSVTYGDKAEGLCGYEVSANLMGLPDSVEILAHTGGIPDTLSADLSSSDVTVYHKSGNIGFSTGTIQWSWALDDFNTGLGPNSGQTLRLGYRDTRVEKVTRNALERMLSADPETRASQLGTSGYLLALNGSSSRVDVPHSAGLNTLPITVSAWVRANGDGGIVSKYDGSSNNGYEMFVWDGRLRAYYFAGSGNVSGGNNGLDGGPINDGRWHHTVFAVDTSGGSLYVDGRLVDQRGWTGSSGQPTTGEALHFGCSPGSTRPYLKGAVDEVAVWNRALPLTEIKDIYGGASPSSMTGLLGLWKFDEASGSTAIDASGAGRNGTYAPTPTCRVASNLQDLRGRSVYQPLYSDANAWTSEGYYSTIGYPDVDGDGVPDVCGRGAAGMDCWTSKGKHFTVGIFDDAGGWNAYKYYSTIRYGDVDGDHRDDVCARGAAGYACFLSTAAGPFQTYVQGPPLSDAGGWDAHKYYSTIQLADINGDGKKDVCYRGAAGLSCVRSTGSGFGPEVFVMPLSDAAGWGAPQYYSTIQFPDIDGDGLADVCARGAAGVICGISTASTPGTTAVSGPPLSDAGGWNLQQYYSTIRFADIDGDKKQDICYRGSAGLFCMRSTGSGFNNQIMVAQLSDALGWSAAKYYSTIRFADLNNDGKADFCARGGAGVTCALSMGTSFSLPLGEVAPYNDANQYDQHMYYTTFQLVDVNHDNKADLCIRNAFGVRCDLSRFR